MESWYVTAVLNQCPHCQQGQLFHGWIRLPPTCDICGARFERWPGAWTGPTVGGYGVGCVVASILTLYLYRTKQLVPGAEWGIALAAVVSILLVYRPIKAGWMGMLYDWGYVYPDPPKRVPAPIEASGDAAAPPDPVLDGGDAA